MSTQLIRLVNGGTVQVREGILRGVGPVGPEGPEGPAGSATTIRGSLSLIADLPAAGSQGDAYVVEEDQHLWVWNADLVPPRWVDAGQIVGPPGDLQSPGARFVNSAMGTVPGTSWQVLDLGTLEYNDVQSFSGGDVTVVTKVNDTEFGVNHPVPGTTGQYMMTAEVTITTSAGSTAGWRIIGLFKNGTLQAQQGVYDPGADNTAVSFSVSTQQRSTTDADRYTVRILANDSFPVTVDSLAVTISRLGGGVGPEGPQGPEGAQGPQGVQGPAGAAQDGFADYDAVTGGGRDSSSDPGGTGDTTAEQAFPVPGKTQRPHTPFFLKQLATALERYVVGRFADFTDMTSRASSDPGEVMYNEGTTDTWARGLYLRHDAGTPAKVPTVKWGTAAPSPSTTDPDGTIFLVYTP